MNECTHCMKPQLYAVAHSLANPRTDTRSKSPLIPEPLDGVPKEKNIVVVCGSCPSEPVRLLQMIGPLYIQHTPYASSGHLLYRRERKQRYDTRSVVALIPGRGEPAVLPSRTSWMVRHRINAHCHVDACAIGKPVACPRKRASTHHLLRLSKQQLQ